MNVHAVFRSAGACVGMTSGKINSAGFLSRNLKPGEPTPTIVSTVRLILRLCPTTCGSEPYLSRQYS